MHAEASPHGRVHGASRGVSLLSTLAVSLY